jgi:hypothetical protein
MKKFIILLFAAVITVSEAQIQTPAPSPNASVSTVVGLTDIKINYARPRAKGRKIFGEGDAFLTPYGKIWRTGANNGTRISFSDDVKVEGIAVPKGEYLLLTWPGATEWTVSLYKDLGLGGNVGGYKPENDIAKFKVKSEKLTERVETFTMNIGDIADNNTSAKVQIAWENTSVKFTVTVDFDSKVMKSIADGTKVSPSAYATAATYYFENGKDLKQALTWIDEAIKGSAGAFWYVHTKAKIQKAAGDKAGALASATQSLEMAKKSADGDFGYIKLNEDLIKTLK